MLLHIFSNILVKKLFGNDLVGRFSCYLYYLCRKNRQLKYPIVCTDKHEQIQCIPQHPMGRTLCLFLFMVHRCKKFKVVALRSYDVVISVKLVALKFTCLVVGWVTVC